MTENNSCGPKTEIGKQISSRNATKHGCCSIDNLLVHGETIQQFQALEATWIESFKPHDEAESHLLNQLVEADWFRLRANRTLAQVEAKIMANNPDDPTCWTNPDHHNIQRFQRYLTTRINIFNKCKKSLEDYRKDRAQQDIVAQRSTIVQERHELLRKEKKSAQRTWEDELDLMREKAKLIVQLRMERERTEQNQTESEA